MAKKLFGFMLGLMLLVLGLVPQQFSVHASVETQNGGSICGGLLKAKSLNSANPSLIYPAKPTGQNYRVLFDQAIGGGNPNTIYGSNGWDIRSVFTNYNNTIKGFLAVSMTDENNRKICVIRGDEPGVQYSPESGLDPFWSESLNNFVVISSGQLLSPRPSGGYMNLTQGLPGDFIIAHESVRRIYAVRNLNGQFAFGELRKTSVAGNGDPIFIFDPLLTEVGGRQWKSIFTYNGLILAELSKDNMRGFYPLHEDQGNWEIASPIFAPGPYQSPASSPVNDRNPYAYLVYANTSTGTYWLYRSAPPFTTNMNTNIAGSTAPIVNLPTIQTEWRVFMTPIQRNG